MTLTAAAFRVVYPEFSSTVTYTDATIDRLIALAVKLLPETRWKDLLDDGIGLYVAHYLSLSARAARLASSSAIPGAVVGVLSAKAVDKVSASYDVSATTLEGAGHWNGTSYGVQFWQLAMMVGAGPVQL